MMPRVMPIRMASTVAAVTRVRVWTSAWPRASVMGWPAMFLPEVTGVGEGHEALDGAAEPFEVPQRGGGVQLQELGPRVDELLLLRRGVGAEFLEGIAGRRCQEIHEVGRAEKDEGGSHEPPEDVGHHWNRTSEFGPRDCPDRSRSLAGSRRCGGGTTASPGMSPERRRDRRSRGPDAFPAVLLGVAGYFCAHSQKFHQTPVWFGMYFTPVMRSLYASTPTDWNSGRP